MQSDNSSLYDQASMMDGTQVAKAAFAVLTTTQNFPSKSQAVMAMAVTLAAYCEDLNLDPHRFITYANNFLTRASAAHPECLAMTDTLKELSK